MASKVVVAALAAAAGILTFLVVLFYPSAPRSPSPGPRSPAPSLESLPVAAAFAGKTVRIDAGSLPLTDLTTFLAAFTGLPVRFGELGADVGTLQVTIAAPIDGASVETIRDVLRANGYGVRVVDEALVVERASGAP